MTFFKINFFEKFFQEYNQSVKHFGSRSGPDLDPNCLQSYQQTTEVGKELKCDFIHVYAICIIIISWAGSSQRLRDRDEKVAILD